MTQTTEKAFETYVEEILLTRATWKAGTTAEWDKEWALFPAQVFAFIPFLRPPLPEQRAIADYLDRETAKIDGLVAKVGAAVERLQEYRTALVTAAVTGKIDVRRQAERSIKGGNHEN